MGRVVDQNPRRLAHFLASNFVGVRSEFQTVQMQRNSFRIEISPTFEKHFLSMFWSTRHDCGGWTRTAAQLNHNCRNHILRFLKSPYETPFFPHRPCLPIGINSPRTAAKTLSMI